MDRIKLGFIGVGGMGQHHLKTVAQMPEAQVVAICDVNEELAQSLAAAHGGRAYGNHHDLLEKEKLDALYIAVPPFAHTDAELIAAGKGIHLFVEKPVDLSLEKAHRVRDAIRRAGVISTSGYVLRYYKVNSLLRSYLAGKKIAMISVCRWGGPIGGWWSVMSRSGGQLVEQTTHQVDLVRYTTGKEIVSVYADYALRVMGDAPGFDIPDVYSTSMRLEDGTLVSLSTACTMRRGGGASSMSFLLDGELIEAGWTTIKSLPEPNPALDGEHGVEMDIDRAFVDAVRTGDRSLLRIDYADAVRTLAVTLAANESAQTGKPVQVQLD
jgi:predicted dehydrogenase